VSVPAPSEEVCGDDWAVIHRDGQTLILLVDGLGHGAAAAEAAGMAVRLVQSVSAGEPVAILEAAHAALRGTRGAALAIARLDPTRGEVRYAGIGNIAGVVTDSRTGRTIRLVTENGTVGHIVRKIRGFDYPWGEDALLILHSDGVAPHWGLEAYPGLVRRHPALLAGVLYRDHKRPHDDASVVVVRRGGATP
jgi:serine phosphatase RsbU (regulator of sigma subunit)